MPNNNQILTTRMSNGLTLVYIPTPGSKTVAVSARVIAGSIYEKEGEFGAAHFLEHLVLDGSEKYPDAESLAEVVEKRGGRRFCSTNRESINYQIKVLKENYIDAFECLAEIIQRPLLLDSDVEKEKKIIIEEINRFKNNPEMLITRLVPSALYAGDRAGGFVTGTIEDVNKLTSSILRGYWKKTHVANNIVIAICGDLNWSDVQSIVQKNFSDLPSGEMMSKEEISKGTQAKEIEEIVSTCQKSYIAVAIRLPNMSEKDIQTLSLITSILGKGRSARLIKVLREQNYLIYNIGINYIVGRNLSYFYVWTSLSPQNLSLGVSLIESELIKMIDTIVSSDELEKCLNLIKAGMVFSFEDSLNLASFYSDMWCTYGKIMTIEKLLQICDSINPDDVKNLSSCVFSQDLSKVFIKGK